MSNAVNNPFFSQVVSVVNNLDYEMDKKAKMILDNAKPKILEAAKKGETVVKINIGKVCYSRSAFIHFLRKNGLEGFSFEMRPIGYSRIPVSNDVELWISIPKPESKKKTEN